jgi:hypothetical protein
LAISLSYITPSKLGACSPGADDVAGGCQILPLPISRYRFKFQSNLVWDSIKNQSATFAFNFSNFLSKIQIILTIKSYNFNNKGTVDLSPTYRAPVF